MRKATLYLIVAAITLWTGTVAWSMPQEKKPETNSKSSGHATEKADSTDQASDAAQQGDDASSKDATVKRKKQPRDKENASEEKDSKPTSSQPTMSVKWMAPEAKTTQPSSGSGGNGATNTNPTFQDNGMAGEMPTHRTLSDPNSGSGGGGGGGAAKGRESPTLNTIRYPTSKPVTDVQAAPGGEENPKETVTPYKDGEDGTTRIRKKPDMVIPDPPNSNSTTGRESPSKGTLGATSIKQSKDVAPDSGGAPAPEGAVTFGREKLKATTKTQGDFNLSNRTSGGGEENPKESVTTPDGTSGAKEIKRKDGAIHSADFRSSGGDNHETVEYKDPEDMTTRGLTKPPPPPPGGPGGVDDASKHKNNMSGAQSNPMYKESKKEGTNPLYEGKDGVAPPDTSGGGAPDAQRMKNAGDYNLSHKFSVEISGKAGKDQNGVTGGEENPKETVTGSSDAEKQKRPGRPAYGNISMQKQGAPTGEENPKETVTQSDSSGRKGYEYYKAQSDMSAKEKKGNTLCGTTDHLRECKPGETPTVTDTSGGTGSDSATAKKKPHEPPPNISDGAAKGQAQEGVAPNPNSGDSGNAAGGTPASPK